MDTNFIGWNGRILVSDRTDPNGAGFAAFRDARGPRGNPAIGFSNTGKPHCYAINELWVRRPGSNEVYRAILTPENIPALGGGSRPDGAGWALHVQDAFGSWSTQAMGSGSPNARPAAPWEWPAPSLMSIGELSPQIYGCVTGLSDDGAVTSTFLVEAVSPEVTAAAASVSPVPGSPMPVPPSGVIRIQDLLNGDNRFVASPPGAGPLVGPSAPPTPTVSGPGAPFTEGAVMCAMTQQGDDTMTRTLHMLKFKKGDHELFHAAASNWGPVTQDIRGTFNRFRAVSMWGNVPAVLGADFGEIISAAMVGKGTALHVFFVAKKDGLYKLWHTARFSNGSWRPVVDVFSESTGDTTGTVYEYKIAIGVCPPRGAASWNDQEAGIIVAMLGGPDGGVYTMEWVPTPRVWISGRPPSNYSQMFPVPSGMLATSGFFSLDVSVSARPYPD